MASLGCFLGSEVRIVAVVSFAGLVEVVLDSVALEDGVDDMVDDSLLFRLVVSDFVPNLNHDVGASNRNSDAIQAVAGLQHLVKILADGGQAKVTPHGLDLLLGETQHPKSTIFIFGIFPHRLNTLLHQVQARLDLQAARKLVVEALPESLRMVSHGKAKGLQLEAIPIRVTRQKMQLGAREEEMRWQRGQCRNDSLFALHHARTKTVSNS